MKLCELSEVARNCGACPVRLLYPPDPLGMALCPDFETKEGAIPRMKDIHEYLSNAEAMSGIMLRMLDGHPGKEAPADA